MATNERRLLSAKRLCAGRTMRREEFPEELFGDFAWSMLMLTYIAQIEGGDLTPDQLFAKANVSDTVGRRWAAFLVEQDLLVIEPALRLTQTASDRLDRYVDRVIDIASGQRPI